MENDYRVITFSFFLLYGLLGLLLPRHSFLCCLKLCRYNMLCYVAKNHGLLALQHSRAEILSMLFVLLLRQSCDCSAEGTISLSWVYFAVRTYCCCCCYQTRADPTLPVTSCVSSQSDVLRSIPGMCDLIVVHLPLPPDNIGLFVTKNELVRCFR